MQKLNCANAQGLLRIIQSIPSPKAEPFKLWLAQVGSDRLYEIENPELATSSSPPDRCQSGRSFSIGFSCRLTEHRIPAQQKALTLAHTRIFVVKIELILFYEIF